MMFKLCAVLLMTFVCVCTANADMAQYMDYLKVDMEMPLPSADELLKNLDEKTNSYNKGYISRFKMGKRFKKEFGRTIKLYGVSEKRIKSSYEDDLLEILSWMPKSMYQYIGPMLHEIPGMSEKILNMPGIKETKNQFPQDIDEGYKGIENIEFLSPALYVLLMPRNPPKNSSNIEKPVQTPAKKAKELKDIPDYFWQLAGIPNNKPEKKSLVRKTLPKARGRTLFPTATSPLTTEDAVAVIATLNDINAWGQDNNLTNLTKMLTAEMILTLWEMNQEGGVVQSGLKDIVNPCQRIVLKTRFAGLYYDFGKIVAKQGFSPEEWAYTCDKTMKAFRVAEADHAVAYAVQFHRRGYYHQFIDKLPQKWKEQMYANEAAIVAMYTVLKEDVDAIRPVRAQLRQKIMENDDMLLTSPVFY